MPSVLVLILIAWVVLCVFAGPAMGRFLSMSDDKR